MFFDMFIIKLKFMIMKRMFLIPTMVFGLFMMGCTGNQSKVDIEHTESDAPHLVTEDDKAELIPLEDQVRSEEHTSELQSRENLVCRLLLEKKKNKQYKKDDIKLE